MRTILVLIHAGAGIGGLLVGPPSLVPPGVASQMWVRRLYAVCIVVLLQPMAGMIAVGRVLTSRYKRRVLAGEYICTPQIHAIRG